MSFRMGQQARLTDKLPVLTYHLLRRATQRGFGASALCLLVLTRRGIK